uniref:Uncharacterized protein n=1 Tax=Oryza punctata TaxID=4537 RepID=A0A0E0MDK9_ORYPU
MVVGTGSASQPKRWHRRTPDPAITPPLSLLLLWVSIDQPCRGTAHELDHRGTMHEQRHKRRRRQDDLKLHRLHRWRKRWREKMNRRKKIRDITPRTCKFKFNFYKL